MTNKPKFFRPGNCKNPAPSLINIEMVGFVNLVDWGSGDAQLEIILTNGKLASVFYDSLSAAESDLKNLTYLIEKNDK